MILSWPDCVNARDLGGLPTTDGRSIRLRALLRSDNHDRLTSRGVQAIRDHGVSRILDLRWEWEAVKYRSPFAGDPIYLNLPLLVEHDDDDDSYPSLIDRSAPLIAAAFTAIAEAPAGGVLVHCHAGRDRTGILVAFALLAAGVPASVVADDYAVSDICEREVMLETIAHLESRYGGAVSFLRDGGVTNGQIQVVRGRLRT